MDASKNDRANGRLKVRGSAQQRPCSFIEEIPPQLDLSGESDVEFGQCPCPQCGDPMEARDVGRGVCRSCRSPRGKVLDLHVAIMAPGDSPDRIPEWRAVRSLLRRRFEKGSSIACDDLWARLLDWLAEEGIAVELALAWTYDELVAFLRRDARENGAQQPPKRGDRTWFEKAKAMLLADPQLSDADVARAVGKNKGTLSKDEEYQALAIGLRVVLDTPKR